MELVRLGSDVHHDLCTAASGLFALCVRDQEYSCLQSDAGRIDAAFVA